MHGAAVLVGVGVNTFVLNRRLYSLSPTPSPCICFLIQSTVFLYLTLNSHVGSCLFPAIFLKQKSKNLEFFNVLGMLSGLPRFLKV